MAVPSTDPGDERPEPPPWDDITPASGPDPADVPPEWAMDQVPRPTASSMRGSGQGAESDRLATMPAGPPPAPQAPQARTVVPVVPTTPLGDRWADVVARMQQDGLLAALVRELAMQAECVGVQDDGGTSVWRLRVERETLRGDTQRERLASALQKVLGGEVRIEVESGVAKDSPALRDQALRASRQLAAEVLIQQDPLVTSLLAQYPGARIVSGSISPL